MTSGYRALAGARDLWFTLYRFGTRFTTSEYAEASASHALGALLQEAVYGFITEHGPYERAFQHQLVQLRLYQRMTHPEGPVALPLLFDLPDVDTLDAVAWLYATTYATAYHAGWTLDERQAVIALVATTEVPDLEETELERLIETNPAILSPLRRAFYRIADCGMHQCPVSDHARRLRDDEFARGRQWLEVRVPSEEVSKWPV